jgi:hypothetical protein
MNTFIVLFFVTAAVVSMSVVNGEPTSAGSESFNDRQFFILGNSVLRHYSFALFDILNASSYDVDDTDLGRIYERDQCGGVLGTNHCEHLIPARKVKILFWWKRLLGLQDSTFDTRDICPDGQCLGSKFSEYNASSRDVLIIGTLPIIQRLGAEGLFNSMAFMLRNYTVSHAIQACQLLVDVFPGRIIFLPFTTLSDFHLDPKG